ncbi:MAG: YitT family protein [Clostridia bacterium]|nr:YitT family protein [Clostridia bacterium]
MSKREIAKRYALFIISLFFAALGVALTKRGELGVSPSSSCSNVLSIRFPAISIGTWLIGWNSLLLIGQILILRKKFKPIQLLQLPLSILFGYFTDFGVWCVSFIPNDVYTMRLILVVAGTVTLGFGISLAVIANVVMNSAEAFVQAVVDKTGRIFGNIKIVFDISCVALAIVLSLILFDMTVVGVREGTVIAAILTGLVVKFFQKRLQKPLGGVLKGRTV